MATVDLSGTQRTTPWFTDRQDAGAHLARRLEHLHNRSVVVLGLFGGGVPVAAAVARVARRRGAARLVLAAPVVAAPAAAACRREADEVVWVVTPPGIPSVPDSAIPASSRTRRSPGRSPDDRDGWRVAVVHQCGAVVAIWSSTGRRAVAGTGPGAAGQPIRRISWGHTVPSRTSSRICARVSATSRDSLSGHVDSSSVVAWSRTALRASPERSRDSSSSDAVPSTTSVAPRSAGISGACCSPWANRSEVHRLSHADRDRGRGGTGPGGPAAPPRTRCWRISPPTGWRAPPC